MRNRTVLLATGIPGPSLLVSDGAKRTLAACMWPSEHFILNCRMAASARCSPFAIWRSGIVGEAPTEPGILPSWHMNASCFTWTVGGLYHDGNIFQPKVRSCTSRAMIASPGLMHRDPPTTPGRMLQASELPSGVHEKATYTSTLLAHSFLLTCVHFRLLIGSG
jgi:hypothetical protein